MLGRELLRGPEVTQNGDQDDGGPRGVPPPPKGDPPGDARQDGQILILDNLIYKSICLILIFC